MTDADRPIAEWYGMLTERERRSLIGYIPGSLEYGLTKNFGRLPDKAQVAIRQAYERRMTE